ncbi:STAS domain-containing protein [Actinokineospora pegani]|uniref:STAS domain-containing protein n=1 Tax=Actinokineospora pegani TaxID=2654637 RepID=UPI0012EA6C4F|nr:STAS domain-containing protein [Actinokineospora pegani]
MSESDSPMSPAGRVESSAGSVELVPGDAVTVLRVSGALDLALAPKLQQLVDRAERAAESTPLVIDLTSVDFLASAGMSVLVRAHQQWPTLRVVAEGRVVLRPLQMTRLTDVLDIYPSLDAAVAGR